MRHIQDSDRAQSLPLPASTEDYVEANNPVRASEAFVADSKFSPDLSRPGLFPRVPPLDGCAVDTTMTPASPFHWRPTCEHPAKRTPPDEQRTTDLR